MIDVNYNEYKEAIAQNMKLIVENHDLKEEIEQMNKELLERERHNQERISKLNNIINEFDKYLVSAKNSCIYNNDTFIYKVVSNIYNKFQELKGVDKE